MITTHSPSPFCRLASVLAAVAAAACVSHPTNQNTVGSMYLKSANIGPAGGTLTIFQSDSAALAGTSITVPAGALSETVLIGISPSAVPVAQTGDTAAGPVVDFEPEGTKFALPVTMTLPLSLSDTTADLAVEAVEATGSSTLLAIQSVSNGLATFQASGFTRFGIIIHFNPDAGVICFCPDVSGCAISGPGPCFCPIAVTCDGGDNTCNTNADCGIGNYCAGNGCGTAGQCEPVPQACDQTCQSPELCGCDGESFCNSCMAAAAGTRVDSTGGSCEANDGGPAPDAGQICACPAGPGPGQCSIVGPGPCFCEMAVPCDGGNRNTCMSNADCGRDNYCAGQGCGTAGSCQPIPATCPADCMEPELCGCNGETYCNSCVAEAAGTRVDSSGGSCEGGVDGGTICSCPGIPAGACTTTGPGPCFCPTQVACDGGVGSVTCDEYLSCDQYFCGSSENPGCDSANRCTPLTVDGQTELNALNACDAIACPTTAGAVCESLGTTNVTQACTACMQGAWSTTSTGTGALCAAQFNACQNGTSAPDAGSGSGCATDSQCMDGERCCEDNGTCHTPVGPGDECDCENPCASDEVCVPTGCGSSVSRCFPGCDPGTTTRLPDVCPDMNGEPAICLAAPAAQVTQANEGGACVVTSAVCDGGSGAIDAGSICLCPAGPGPGECSVMGPPPCYCAEAVACDGGNGEADGGSGSMDAGASNGDCFCSNPLDVCATPNEVGTCFDNESGGAHVPACVSTSSSCGALSVCPTGYDCQNNACICNDPPNCGVICGPQGQCPCGLVCSGQNTCVACAFDENCPAGQYCSQQNDCKLIPVTTAGPSAIGAACTQNSNCQSELCIDSTCVQPCERNADCSAGLVCWQPGTGLDPGPSGCVLPSVTNCGSSCTGAAKICTAVGTPSAGSCVQWCTAESDCSGGNCIAYTSQKAYAAPLYLPACGTQSPVCLAGEFELETDNTTPDPIYCSVGTSCVTPADCVGQYDVCIAPDNSEGLVATLGTCARLGDPNVTLAISPANAQIPIGETVQFAGNATYNNGTTQNVTTSGGSIWVSSDPTILSFSASKIGFATSLAQGTVTVSFTQYSVTTTTTATVGPIGPVSLAITPNITNVAVGLSRQLSVTATESDGSTQDVSTEVTWSSSDASVATISATGSLAGVSTGAATITAMLGAVSASFSVSVTTTPTGAVSMAITPQNPNFNFNQTLQLTATVTYHDGTTSDATDVAFWSSGDVSTATVSSTGFLTGVAPNTVVITATLGTLTASDTINVGL